MSYENFKPLIEKVAHNWYRFHPEYTEDIRQLSCEAFLMAERDWNNPEKKANISELNTHYNFLFMKMRSYMRRLVLEEINIISPSSYEIAGFKDKRPEKRTFVSDDVLAWCFRRHPSQEYICDRKQMHKNINEFCRNLKDPKRADYFISYINDVSFADIGQKYGVSRQAVECSVKKSLDKFMKTFYPNKKIKRLQAPQD